MTVTTMLTPVLALIVWTFVIWLWMYATRLPAMRAAGINPARMRSRGELDALPLSVRQIADNYNHLHEQPTIFYALALYTHLAGTADMLNESLAWSYVALRIVHSLIQCTTNFVPVRFFIFVAGTLALMIIAGRNVAALFTPMYY
jgi:hypothetical protein